MNTKMTKRLAAMALTLTLGITSVLSASVMAAQITSTCDPDCPVCGTQAQVNKAAVASFPDVPSTHTFYASIMDCAAKGIVGGYANGTFGPANTVTRSNFTVMLSRAFYADDVAKYSASKPDGASAAWANLQAMLNAGMLASTSFANLTGDQSEMDKGITRYDMAQLMTNIMAANNFSASSAEKTAAIAKIADYASIPTQYRDAVANVFALGIIGGYADGSFKGIVTMNRGQACAVIYRMLNKLGNPEISNPGTGTQTPSEPETGSCSCGLVCYCCNDCSNSNGNTAQTPVQPEPEKPTQPVTPPTNNTEITVSNTTTSGGHTAWRISDNKNPTGYLNNGKAITEENVIELLKDASNQWTTGLSWADFAYGITNCYDSEGNTSIGAKLCLKHYVSTEGGCGAFAAMISDYVFGKTNNPARKITDISAIRPGDIIFCIDNGKVSHVQIATSHVTTKNNWYYVFVGEGNCGQQVRWDNWDTIAAGKNGSAYLCPVANATDADSYCIVYTRYPA